MSDKPSRVLPSSRQPVTPEAQASATTETGGPTFSDPGDDSGIPMAATNPVWPTVSSAAAEVADEPARTATLDDATRFAGGTTEMHQGGELTLPPGMPESSDGAAHVQGDRSVEDEASTPGTALTGVESGRPPGASAAAGMSAGAGMAAGATVLPGGASGRHATPSSGSSSGSSSSPAGSSPRSSPSRPPQRSRSQGPRSAEDIERDIEETRSRLAGTVDEINDRVKPANIKVRAQTQARGLVMTPDGQVRKERVGPVAGVLGALLLIRVLRNRRKK